MKIGIITFHFVNNYGGVLQAYALRHFIKKNYPVECKIIDYRHWFIRFTDAVRMFPLPELRKKRWPRAHTFRERVKRVKKFRRFIESHGNLTTPHLTYRHLKKEKDSFDLLICGSDQIWNPLLTMGPAKAYYLRFAGKDTRKISYAASVGSPPCFRKKIISYIRDLDAVSIREREDWIDKVISPVPVQNIDPTFLLDIEDWEKVCAKPISKEPYILVYFMQSNNEAYSVIEKIKNRLGLPVYDISRYGYSPDFVDKTLVNVGPEDFLGLFRNAAYVCTNSFHGLAFSLIFQKQAAFIPLKRFGYRIESLCDMFRIELSAEENGAYFDVEYDVEHFNKVVKEERERAVTFIGKNIAYD